MSDMNPEAQEEQTPNATSMTPMWMWGVATVAIAYAMVFIIR